ncbi:reverse transcriptase (RNA-dependent DNA polymerase) domain-containing protein [Ditylenchus destructor]|uniref:Reverse transcriptase (RNA-dependent DNA polymerase) domain-containing protein n=1 Tax=Ditylenchus destructor TaxID=166010 RepID=A0AAD4QY77_9BILA|nr:reverse transcriptase (RNA-dependent DNA polymerase) domain-containing protein [Ditylenchus destructor]
MNWSVNSSGQVTDTFKSNHKVVKGLYCGDFSNLFTALPHKEVLNNIMYLVEMTFNGNSSNTIQCNQYRSFFSTASYAKYEPYNLTDTSMLISFLVRNSYVQFAGKNFQQICGIPQGGNASPILADLTLTAMEIRFMRSCKDHDLKKEISMSFRYIDDILCLSESFSSVANEIYGTVLELNKTDLGNLENRSQSMANESVNIEVDNGSKSLATEDAQVNTSRTKYVWCRPSVD